MIFYIEVFPYRLKYLHVNGIVKNYQMLRLVIIV